MQWKSVPHCGDQDVRTISAFTSQYKETFETPTFEWLSEFLFIIVHYPFNGINNAYSLRS